MMLESSYAGGVRRTPNLEMWDLVFGRALGRVLAHEHHHIIGRTRAHTTSRNQAEVIVPARFNR